VVIGDDDICALGQRSTGDRRSDSGTGRGCDDDDLSGQKSMSLDLFGDR
jgi:hypothetical protein